MDHAHKQEALAQLQAEITRVVPDSWTFPPIDRVRGFLGVGPLMVVAERPSKGKSGMRALQLFYRVLSDCGATTAHLTDVVKSRGKVDDPYPDDMGIHRRFFDRELDIVRPEMIVALGGKVHDLLLFALAGTGIRIRRAMHYAYGQRWGVKSRAAFDDQMRQALRA